MLVTPYKLRTCFIVALAFVAAVSGSQAQDASQLGFSQLQAQANALVEQGQLTEALPLLEELIVRVDSSDNADFKLDFALYLVGTAYIQRYVDTGNVEELNQSLIWYDRLERDYPKSPNVKRAVLKRIDILRAIGRTDEAIALMREVLSGQKNLYLNQQQLTKMLKDLCQIYYGEGKFEEGMPYFDQLIARGITIEDKSLGAAASFEGLVEANSLDEAIKRLPLLAKESSVRYLPRLNVALLKASDTMVEDERYTDAALILNLIKTTDLMIEYNENKLAEKLVALDRAQAFGSQERIDGLRQEVESLKQNLENFAEMPALRNELLVRRARNFSKTDRPYESFWMFFDLLNENPGDKREEFYHFAAFSGRASSASSKLSSIWDAPTAKNTRRASTILMSPWRWSVNCRP